MTRYSQNGYPACVTSLLSHYRIPGTGSGSGLSIVMRDGATQVALSYFIQRWDHEIEPVYMLGCYACRDIIGSATTSNHASGTAVDINWEKHGLGTHPSATLSAKVHRILNTRIGGIRVGDVLRWGGDYHSRKDPMHIEINAPLSLVKRLAAAILAQNKPKPPPPAPPTPVEEIVMEGIVYADHAPVAGQPSAKFYYNFVQRIWIQDEDHLSRIRGEFAKRNGGKAIIETQIGDSAPIRAGKYGVLIGQAPPPGTY